MIRTQVIIAGAGPVGTVAAFFLAERGVDVVVLEQAASCEEDLRASTLHAPTLEMLDELGISKALCEQGLKAPVYQYRIRKTDEVLSFDLSELEGEVRFPYRLQCEQYKLARMLADRLDRHSNAQIYFEHRVVSFEQFDSGVTVSAETPLTIKHFEADYFIGADGANSIVRKWLGVDFSGFTYPEKFLTLSTTTPLEDYFHDLSYVNYISDPHEWLVLLRVPSMWRVLVPANQDDRDDYLLSDEHKNRIFDGIVADGSAVTTGHRTIYRVHQRVVSKFNHGRVMLVGDAAHLNNPLGGFGMNSGIHDAWNLCEKLLRIIKGREKPGPLLDLYDRQRRTVMNNFIQTQTIKNKKMMEEGTEKFLRGEWEELQKTHENADARRDFLLRQSMIHSLRDAEAIT